MRSDRRASSRSVSFVAPATRRAASTRTDRMLVCHLARSAAVAALVASLIAFSVSDRPAALRASSSAWAARRASWASFAAFRSAAIAFFPASPSASVSPVAGVAVAGVGSDAGLTGVVWAGVAPAAAGVAPAGVVVSGMVVLVASWRKGCLDVRHHRRHGGRGSRLGWCGRGRGEPLPDEGDLARREAELLPDGLLVDAERLPLGHRVGVRGLGPALGVLPDDLGAEVLPARVVTEREVEPEDLLPGLALVELRVEDLGDEARLGAT